MHPNKIFREATAAQNVSFARGRGFGVVTIASPEGLLAAHAPFLISEDESTVELHLSNANPMLKYADDPVDCLLVVSGPDAYVSPDWYALDHNQVPTWNYVAVHVRGKLQKSPHTELAGLLERLSGQFETQLAPKQPWRIEKMEPAVFERMQRAITPLRISVESIDGTWKLGQNKAEDARLRAAAAIEASSVGLEVSEVSTLMTATIEASKLGEAR